MSITPKLLNINENRKVRLHMRVDNPTKSRIKGSINFIIISPNKKRVRISKEVAVSPLSKKDSFIKYKIKPHYKEGLYKVIAFFSYDNKKVFSTTSQNDFFWVLNYKKNQKEWDSLFFNENHPLVNNINSEISEIIEEALDTKNPKILDIGCGTGEDINLLSKHIRGKIYGIDISKKAINHAKKKFGRGSREINLITRDFTKIKFPGNYFDIIYSFSFFHCLLPQDIYPVLKKIKRILKRNGTLFLKTRSLKDAKYRWGKKIYNSLFLQNKLLVNFLDKKTLKNYLIPHFKILEIKEKIYTDKGHGKSHKHAFLIARCKKE